jgi:hypothetical protein
MHGEEQIPLDADLVDTVERGEELILRAQAIAGTCTHPAARLAFSRASTPSNASNSPRSAGLMR